MAKVRTNNVGGNVGGLGPSYAAGGNVKGSRHFGNCLAIPQTVKHGAWSGAGTLILGSHVPGCETGASPALPRLFGWYYYPNFTDEQSEAQRS